MICNIYPCGLSTGEYRANFSLEFNVHHIKLYQNKTYSTYGSPCIGESVRTLK